MARRSSILHTAFFVAAVLVVAGCGDDGGDEPVEGVEATTNAGSGPEVDNFQPQAPAANVGATAPDEGSVAVGADG